MYETIGQKIKSLREKVGISQEALAHNICAQSEISRIENDKNKPSLYLLNMIAEKLGVNANYFLENESGVRSDYIVEVRSQLQKARRHRDYKLIQEIVQLEEKNPLFHHGEIYSYLMWHKGIVQYHLQGDSELAISTLINCLTRTSLNENHIHILNSLGIICRNEGRLKDAQEHLEKAYSLVQSFPLDNQKTIMKVIYNLSKVYTDLDYFDESLSLCNRGLEYCRNNEMLFLLAEFHYQIGRNYLKKEQVELGLKYWENACAVLRIEGKTELLSIIEQEIELYRNENQVV
ncbi:helix-turn-helix domain-containing protein [Tenuibacillus multivorans]|uniref:Transcriptional regulator, contains XRE-family HTH domain n=1 Tax=Tenuibacillus multivorans TaxID=237069 RepID=A0A1G9YMQ2_9BACI|nr:helix-turn-helix domain-containing protein [Tenuibacillus multivorans]GEL78458.1 transcriptional regulator [Tenuibacillus multivorans]SDN09815.1 Transcriptional regulator, contains XRE-family HTH domain [Tenuibacillus multivorans]